MPEIPIAVAHHMGEPIIGLIEFANREPDAQPEPFSLGSCRMLKSLESTRASQTQRSALVSLGARAA